MQSLNSVNSLPGSSMMFVLPLANSATGSTTQSSKALQDVIAQLVQALSKNGQLDESSPLGKMLAKAMAANGQSGGGIEEMKAALDKLIHEKLGANVGASADSGAAATDSGGGLGSGVNSASGLGSNAGTGQSDLMTQVLNGLGKSVLDDLLTQQSNGATFSQDDMPMLEKIAQFMDDNKSRFAVPDSGSWANELKEDNFLDGSETAQFRSALDILGQQLGKQQSDASVAGGGLGSPVSDTASSSGALGDASAASGLGANSSSDANQGLGQLLGELVDRGLQSVLSGSGLGAPVGNTSPATASSSQASPADSAAGGNTASADLGQLLAGLIEKGLEASQQGNSGTAGNPLSDSAAKTAALIVNALLQTTHTQAVA